jgi:hypothetical protein
MTTYIDKRAYDLRELEKRIKRHIDKDLIGMTYDGALLYVADKLDYYKARIEELEDQLLKTMVPK